MARKNQAEIEFKAVTSEFSSGIKEMNGDLKTLQNELKLNSVKLKENGRNTDLLKQRQSLLAKELEKSKEKVSLTNAKLEEAKKIFGEDSREVKNLTSDLLRAQTQEQAIKNDIAATNKKISEQSFHLGTAGEKLSTYGQKIESTGKKMLGVTAATVGVGVAAVTSFHEVEDGVHNVIKATGAAGESARQLEQSYETVASKVVGDFGDIGSTLGEVNTRFGFTGQVLEACTEKFVKFAEVNNTDATSAVQLVSRAMGDANIDAKEYSTVLDALTKAAQASGISIETLAGNITKYGAPMRALGYDTSESIAIFSSWEKAGVNTEIAFSGMKKAISNFSAEGKDAKVEFKKTLEEIKACPDIASATSKAIEVFGQKAGPDLADAIKGGRFEFNEMLNLIKGADGSVEGTFDGLVDGGYEAELAMQNAKLVLSDVGDTLLTSATPAIEEATEKVKGFGNWWNSLGEKTQGTVLKMALVVAAIGPVLIIIGKVSQGVGALMSLMSFFNGILTTNAAATTGVAAAQTAEAAATSGATIAQTGLNAAFLACPITWIVLAIGGLVAAFVVLWNQSEAFRAFWQGMFENIKQVLMAAWAQIKPALSEVGQAFFDLYQALKPILTIFGVTLGAVLMLAASVIMGFVKGAVDSMAPLIKAFGNVIRFVTNVGKAVVCLFTGDFKGAVTYAKAALGDAKNFFTNIFTAIKNQVSGFTSGFKQAFSSALGTVDQMTGKKLSAVFHSFQEKFESIKNVVKGAIEKIKGFFKFDLSLPKIKLPHFSISFNTAGTLGKAAEFLGLPGVPKINVDWYAKGGILTRPTIFGYGNGSFLGGGEAGHEAVLPISNLERYVSNAVERTMEKTGDTTIDYDRMERSFVNAASKINFSVAIGKREFGRILNDY
ncbi:phage tail tape measure protein [Anaerosacchariphilus polymeriproducens]|uniref:Phage tail tape measure protein n=1 Tax=Anaerosacchariphilus polymeriproducens TaxID=1812858 RepID=A0A371ARP8_9FIRM|nr:phage tail tape measure protein [Anaerosacchariphilus polymeriproducens]RDU22212.1 phage tail tape measure protein [Anaerosacchariphilus polymeriproducens]